MINPKRSCFWCFRLRWTNKFKVAFECPVKNFKRIYFFDKPVKNDVLRSEFWKKARKCKDYLGEEK